MNYDLDTMMAFGKYRGTGKTLEDLLTEDPGYLLWAIENEVIEVDNAVYDAIMKANGR